MTTTEGHMRLERARERFTQFAEEQGVMEFPRKRHRLGCELQPASTALESGVYQEGGRSSRGSPLLMCSLQSGVWNRRPR